MSYLKFKNGAFATLSGGIDTDDTTIVLTGGHGARFPTLTAGQVFVGALSNFPANKLEIVLVTARSTDTLTVVRGFGGTAAQDWASNDRFSLRWDMTQAMQFAMLGGANEYIVGSGTANAITGSLACVATALFDGMRVFVEITTGPNSGTATLTLNLDATQWGGSVTAGTPIAISRSFVSATNLEPGDIPGTNFVAEFVYSSALTRWVLTNPAFAGVNRMSRLVNDDYTSISGGSTTSDGGRIDMYGESHATRPNEIDVIASNVFARVTDSFQVLDSGDSSVAFGVTEDGEVSGEALATRADTHARAANRILTPEAARNLPEIAKNIFIVTWNGSASFTTHMSEGHGGVTFSNDGTWNYINFTNSFANTSYKGFLMWNGGFVVLPTAGVFTVVDADTCRILDSAGGWNTTTPVLGMFWGEKASM